jgi:4-hydroxybenzoate polyprenyltransferase
METAAKGPVVLSAAEQCVPPTLAVDLDGTLVKTDVLLESVVALLKQSPWRILSLPIWLLSGRAYFKQQVARSVSLDLSVLPYRQGVLDYLKWRRSRGSAIVLATANDMSIARQVSDHLGLFDSILASDGTLNLSGEAKRDRLVKEFGEKGFDYAGNERRDLVVWAAARKAIAVDTSPGVLSALAHAAQLDSVFQDAGHRIADYFKALRPRHWLRNLLVFVPLLAAHRIDELDLEAKLLLAFLAFACMASGGYLFNDLVDLEADRHHPAKRLRPFAAGGLSLAYALAMVPLLVSLGFFFGKLVSNLFLAAVLIYFALSLLYSLYVKRLVILDVIFLAGLYTIRILAGSAAVGIWPSHWLLAFSIFLFFSLALVKRYGELALMRRIKGNRATARGYELTDSELLAAMGVASGYLAVLVLALYINSAEAQMLYGRYQLIWLLCPLLLYWISDMWLHAHRGEMPDDPVVFAIRDRTSRILILLMCMVGILAL